MQRVMAEEGEGEETMRVVVISWKGSEGVSVDREIVGEEGERVTTR